MTEQQQIKLLEQELKSAKLLICDLCQRLGEHSHCHECDWSDTE